MLITVYFVNIALGHKSWDPYPFILLNLFLSMLAAIQAPVIMMSQNRQDKKDRVRSELDFDVNRRAASDIQGLAGKINLLGEKIGDVEDFIRERIAPTGEQVEGRSNAEDCSRGAASKTSQISLDDKGKDCVRSCRYD